MIDIYNEVAHIKDVLEKGPSHDRWYQDLVLLVRYRKSQVPQPKKSEVKKEMIQKCRKYVTGFKEIADAPNISQLVEKTWKDWKIDREHPENSSKLREITKIEIPEEILEWFLSLPQEVVLNDEELQYYRDRRETLRISNHPINASRLKFLFTLYVWSEIQKNYTPVYTYFDFDKCVPKFKKDANLPTNFSFDTERDFLQDLGFIKTTQKLAIIASFYEKEIFKKDYTDSKKIILSGQDLYDCGAWINLKYKESKNFLKEAKEKKICHICGKIFTVKKGGEKAIYCKKCRKIKKNNRNSLCIKYCVDCGKELTNYDYINKKGQLVQKKRMERCAICQDKRNKEKSASRVAQFRDVTID